MKAKYLLLLFVFTLICCKKDITIENPIACFSIINSNSPFKVGDTVRFSNCSENSNKYYWDFGDGNNSTDVTPNYVYKKPGLYKIELYSSKDK
jgi:PKD repeat protein